MQSSFWSLGDDLRTEAAKTEFNLFHRRHILSEGEPEPTEKLSLL